MFKDENEFSLYIENLQIEKQFDSVCETIVYFYENETDQEMEDIAKLLNRRLKERIAIECRCAKTIKPTGDIDIFDIIKN